jgi:mannitol-1-phosphate/altronate dehydrogenase
MRLPCPAVRLGREIQLNIVELAKADKLASSGNLQNDAGSALTALSAWITYFSHWKEENIMNQIAYPPVLEALQQLKALSADDEARRLAEVRERAIMSENTEIEAALARGKDIGKEIGKEIGAAQAKAEALRRMIESGISEAQARKILQM